MRKEFARLIVLVAVAALVPSSARAWGTAAHRFIMRSALDLLPPEIKPFFDRNRDELVLRVIDPDLWRVIGFDEDANHYLDLGVSEYGAYPFAALPRDFDAAAQKFGNAVLKRNGLLPWRVNEMFGQLRRSFESAGRGDVLAPSNVVLFAAALTHYIQDAHMPLHASNNADGQLTGQRGIHSRFETELFERFRDQLTIHPALPSPVANARDLAFDVLLASHQLVAPLLAADKKAVAGKSQYDDTYFQALFDDTRSMLEQQIAGSITRTAALIVQAWTDAGKPALPLAPPPRTVRSVR